MDNQDCNIILLSLKYRRSGRSSELFSGVRRKVQHEVLSHDIPYLAHVNLPLVCHQEKPSTNYLWHCVNNQKINVDVVCKLKIWWIYCWKFGVTHSFRKNGDEKCCFIRNSFFRTLLWIAATHPLTVIMEILMSITSFMSSLKEWRYPSSLPSGYLSHPWQKLVRKF